MTVVRTATARPPAAFLSALADPTRVRVVRKLAAGEMNLVAGGVVAGRKDGRFVYYGLVAAESDGPAVTLTRPGVSVTLAL